MAAPRNSKASAIVADLIAKDADLMQGARMAAVALQGGFIRCEPLVEASRCVGREAA
jgi:hypothetical protein